MSSITKAGTLSEAAVRPSVRPSVYLSHTLSCKTVLFRAMLLHKIDTISMLEVKSTGQHSLIATLRPKNVRCQYLEHQARHTHSYY